MSDHGIFGPMQFWSENHQIGWKAAQYLIGNLELDLLIIHIIT